MSSIIKHILGVLIISLLPFGRIIQNPSPDSCRVDTIRVERIYEGGLNDVVSQEANGDFFYINPSVENGLYLATLEEEVLHKNITLHLAKVIYGTGNLIAQLAIDDQGIYTEFIAKWEKRNAKKQPRKAPSSLKRRITNSC